jgi:hypothetical protein
VGFVFDVRDVWTFAPGLPVVDDDCEDRANIPRGEAHYA